jgi:hypothetical protein
MRHFSGRVQEDRQHARAPAQRLRGAAADDHRGLGGNLAFDHLLDDLLSRSRTARLQ